MSLKSIFRNLISRPKLENSQFSDSNAAIVCGNNNNVTQTIWVKDDSLASISDRNLLNKMMKEKVDIIRNYLLDFQFDKLSAELDNIFEYGIDHLQKDVAEKFYFYRFCQNYYFQKNDKCAEIIEFLDGEDLTEANWLVTLENDFSESEYSTFLDHTIEGQICALGVLLQKKEIDTILAVYQHCCGEDNIENCGFALPLYAAIAYFNNADVNHALAILDKLDDKRTPVHFFLFFFELYYINESYLDSRNNEKIVSLLNEVEGLKVSAAGMYNANSLLINILFLHSYFNLERTGNHEYLDKAKSLYSALSQEVQKQESICFYYGMCLEAAGDNEGALLVYKKSDWQHNDRIGSKILDLYALEGSNDKFFETYDQIDDKTPLVVGVYLNVIEKEGAKEYTTKLIDEVDKCKNSLEDLYFIAIYVESKESFKNVIVPRLDVALSAGSTFADLALLLRCGYIMKFAQYHEYELLKSVLDTLASLDVLNDALCGSIYKSFFDEANKYQNLDRVNVEPIISLDVISEISERFISEKVYSKQFIQIMMMVSNAEKKPLSRLKYAKELFEITKEPQIAANIIGYLLQSGERDFSRYEEYLEVAGKLNNPQHLLDIALAYQMFDDVEKTELYVYKALRILNGRNDYSVYGRIFLIESQYFGRSENTEPSKHLRTASVITLEDVLNQKIKEICIDGEVEFEGEKSTCFGIEHINRGDIIFRKLVSSSESQILNINDKQYRVKRIESRNDYLLKFIMKKINEAPDKVRPYAQMLTFSTPEEMISQIQEVMHQGDKGRKTVEDYYNFVNNETGLPIDSFCNRNYEEYINKFAVLLFRKDWALYVGEPYGVWNPDSKIVISLPTLSLLAIMDWFDILDPLLDKIVCPESYMPFFKKLYEAEVDTQSRSVGKLIELEDGKLATLENNQKLVDILEKIIGECEKFSKVHVSDEERINYHFFPQVSGEQFPEWLGVDMVQVDAFIAAEKEQAVYLIDDLFFRKLASLKKIPNINFGCLLRVFPDIQRAEVVAKQLSSTNYLYAPFIFSSDEGFKTLQENMMNGKLKQEFYPGYINGYLRALRDIYLKYFANPKIEDADDK